MPLDCGSIHHHLAARQNDRIRHQRVLDRVQELVWNLTKHLFLLRICSHLALQFFYEGSKVFILVDREKSVLFCDGLSFQEQLVAVASPVPCYRGAKIPTLDLFVCHGEVHVNLHDLAEHFSWVPSVFLGVPDLELLPLRANEKPQKIVEHGRNSFHHLWQQKRLGDLPGGVLHQVDVHVCEQEVLPQNVLALPQLLLPFRLLLRRLAVPHVNVVHGLKRLPDLWELLHPFVQQVNRIVHQHVHKLEVKSVGLLVGQGLPVRPVHRNAPQVLEHLPNVMPDVELVVKLGVAASELNVDVELEKVCYEGLFPNLVELEEVCHLAYQGVSDIRRGHPVVQNVHHLGPQVRVVHEVRLTREND
mmetsp:Transcript_33203/g.71587  ORF Transcript_33203/g.71587 Transcript_33203/m.71587 type:complete len:360 (+) Transcript_33203:286-1365(+)